MGKLQDDNENPCHIMLESIAVFQHFLSSFPLVQASAIRLSHKLLELWPT